MIKVARPVYRHSLATRILHWVNAFCVFVALMSGLQIFNAHPRLYWGKSGADADHAAFEIYALDSADDKIVGRVRIGRRTIGTTGILGVSTDADGGTALRAFPRWATIPSEQDLALGRSWHFFFAWTLVVNSCLYLVISLATGHLSRHLVPKREELSAASLARSAWDHVRLRFAPEQDAAQYNVLQKLSYVCLIFGLAPLILATGLAMSPGVDAACPWLLDLFDGRQSARTLHFIAAMTVAAFILLHLVMVMAAGPVNEIRSMITGRFIVSREDSR